MNKETKSPCVMSRRRVMDWLMKGSLAATVLPSATQAGPGNKHTETVDEPVYVRQDNYPFFGH